MLKPINFCKGARVTICEAVAASLQQTGKESLPFHVAIRNLQAITFLANRQVTWHDLTLANGTRHTKLW